MQRKELFQESFREADNRILIINVVNVDLGLLLKSNNNNKMLTGRYLFHQSVQSTRMSVVAPLTILHLVISLLTFTPESRLKEMKLSLIIYEEL